MSRVKVLSHLQEYANLTEAGESDFKSCLFQLTKSRRSQNRGILSLDSCFRAEQLREEFHAFAVVKNEQEQPADLVEEDSSSKSAAAAAAVAPPFLHWKLVNVLEERNRDKENQENAAGQKKAGDGGLRQRKNAPVFNHDEKEWTRVEETENEKELSDPLALFAGGLSPRELKVAQQKAKVALESYIQAANQAAAILALVQKGKQ